MNFLKIVLKKKLKDKIKKAEKIEGGMFAGLLVTFKDDFQNETWMSENLLKIEKPQLVKKAEEYLRKVMKEYTGNKDNESSYSVIQHTALDNWTER